MNTNYDKVLDYLVKIQVSLANSLSSSLCMSIDDRELLVSDLSDNNNAIKALRELLKGVN